MADEAGYLRLVMSPSRGPPAPLVVDSCPQNPGDLPIGVSANSRAISPFLLSTWPPLLGSTRLHCRTDAAQTTKVSCVSRSADEAGRGGNRAQSGGRLAKRLAVCAEAGTGRLPVLPEAKRRVRSAAELRLRDEIGGSENGILQCSTPQAAH